MNISVTKTHQNESLYVSFSTQQSVLSKKEKVTTTKLADKKLAEVLKNSIQDKSLTGKVNEVVLFRELNFENHRHVIVAGLGSKVHAESFRSAAASILSAIKSSKAKIALIDLDSAGSTKKNISDYLKAFTEGLILSSYSFDELKSKSKDADETAALEIRLKTQFAADATVKKALSDATIIAESINFSRRLGDMPGNLMTPSVLADHAVEAAKGTGIKVTVWDKAKIKKEKMGGLLGVSNGSDQEPRFIIMDYKGGASTKKPIVFVGKGLTFDCGGISIKPSAGMEEMKYDMCGGANVIGTILAIAKLKLKVNVTVLVPSTENLTGGSATKPGDIHTARNGKTFEVNNTDAEGRLILSDALCYATELDPQAIVDAATLTGAMMVALGNIHTGYFTKDSSLKKKIEDAALTSGELVWNMPLTEHHTNDMKGTFADLSNISTSKGAGSATAAAFLEQFVGEGIPWAHFDIAGTAWATGNRLHYNPKKGASGVMIRTFIELAKKHL
jgi:leucyl aminopeptidase